LILYFLFIVHKFGTDIRGKKKYFRSIPHFMSIFIKKEKIFYVRVPKSPKSGPKYI